LECLFDPKTSVLKKKKKKKGLYRIWIKRSLIKQNKNNIFAGLEAFFVPKMVQDTSLREGKVVQGGQKYLQGGQLPPTSRAYETDLRQIYFFKI